MIELKKGQSEAVERPWKRQRANEKGVAAGEREAQVVSDEKEEEEEEEHYGVDDELQEPANELQEPAHEPEAAEEVEEPADGVKEKADEYEEVEEREQDAEMERALNTKRVKAKPPWEKAPWEHYPDSVKQVGKGKGGWARKKNASSSSRGDQQQEKGGKPWWSSQKAQQAKAREKGHGARPVGRRDAFGGEYTPTGYKYAGVARAIHASTSPLLVESSIAVESGGESGKSAVEDPLPRV